MVETPRKWETERESWSIYSSLFSGKAPAQLTEQNPLQVRQTRQCTMTTKYYTIIITKLALLVLIPDPKQMTDHNWTSMQAFQERECTNVLNILFSWHYKQKN